MYGALLGSWSGCNGGVSTKLQLDLVSQRSQQGPLYPVVWYCIEVLRTEVRTVHTLTPS